MSSQYIKSTIMILKYLSVIDFKNIKSAELDFSDKINCFIGNNGMGKSNILDAIHYLSFTKSHLGINDYYSISFGKEETILNGVFRDFDVEDKNILLRIKHGERKILKKNKKEYQKISNHIGLIPLVVISPQDNHLVSGGSEIRRKFMDQQLSQQDPVYMNALISYNKVLSQRNTMLKTGIKSKDLIDVIDMQMSKYAKYIHDKRDIFIKQFIPIFNKYYQLISGSKETVSVTYLSSLTQTNGELKPLLDENLSKDIALGYTSVGVHRDDMEMLIGSELIRRVGSQGQQKTFLISLKISQYELLSKNSKTKPILMLDDIFDRLDGNRVGKIISMVSGEDFGQIFITDTNREYIDKIVASTGNDFNIYTVKNGFISME